MDTSKPQNCRVAVNVHHCFLAWKHMIDRSHPGCVPQLEQCWNPRRCVLRKMLFTKEIHPSLKNLVQATHTLMTSGVTSGPLLMMLTSAVKSPWPDIKMVSYSGACLRREAPHGTRRGWAWFDPGNWTYAVLWYILKEISSKYKHTDVWADRFLQIHRACRERWTENQGSQGHWIRLGDMLELVLGNCYLVDTGHSFVHLTHAIIAGS